MTFKPPIDDGIYWFALPTYLVIQFLRPHLPKDHPFAKSMSLQEWYWQQSLIAIILDTTLWASTGSVVVSIILMIVNR